jgi:hypothetical protein
LAGGSSQRGIGSPPAASALETILPVAFDMFLIHRYETERYDRKFEAATWTSPDLKLHDTSVNRPPIPDLLTVSTALTATPWQGQAALGAVVSKKVGSALAREFHERVALGSTLVLAGAGPSPWTALALDSYLTPKSARERYYPFDRIRDYLTEKVQENLAHRLIIADLKTFKAELEKKAKDPEAARKYLAETVQRFGWDHGAMTQPHDRYTISDAEALRPLKEAATRSGQDAKNFTAQLTRLYESPNLYSPQEWPSGWSQGRPEDDYSWTFDPERFLYWKTKDERAYVPDSLTKVRDQVVEAWRFLQARKIADKEAQRLKEEAVKTKGDVQKLKDLAKQVSGAGKYEELGPIAPLLQTQSSPMMGSATAPIEYHPYRVPDEKVPDAGAEFSSKLLTLKDVGDTAVLTNQPEDTYYVATVVKRTPASKDTFYITYMDSAPGTLFRQDTLFSRFEYERRREYQEKILKQLRADAKLTLNPEAAKEERDRSRSEGPEDE